MKRYSDTPVGARVLVQVDSVDTSYGESGIVLHSSNETYDTDMTGHDIGVIKSLGDAAFKDAAHFGDWTILPKVGDRVRFKRYAGCDFRDAANKEGNPDGNFMRVLNDDFIVSLVNVEEVPDA